MSSIASGIRVLADGAPADRRAVILNVGTVIERNFDELVRGQAELAEAIRLVRESVDPAVYQQMSLFRAGISLELAEAYARIADVEIKALISQDERTTLRLDLSEAAAERSKLWTVVNALAADLAIVKAEIARCCGPDGTHARAVGEGA